jgi:signal transduction histidine kinase
VKYLPTIAAIAAVLFGTAVTLGIWARLQVFDERIVQEVVSVAADHAQAEIEGRIDARLDALRRLADLWVRFGPLEREQWELHAQMIHDDFSGFQAIEWIDRDFVVRWISPLSGNEAAQGLDITFESRRKAAVEAARDIRRPSVSRTIELVQGGTGFLAYFPLYRNDEFEGFIVGVFRVFELVDQTIPGDAPKEFTISVFDQGEQIFAEHDVEHPNIRMAISRTIALPGHVWRLRVTPNNRLHRDYYRSLTSLATTASASSTLLFAMSLYFAIASWMRRQQVQDANASLSAEIARRERAEMDLRENLNHLEKMVEDRTDEIARANVDLRKEVDLHQKAKVELEQNQSRLRHLTLDLTMAEERFRKKVAERIHDRVSNGMVLAKLRLGELKSGADAASTSMIDDISQILSATIAESRSMVFELSPPILFELGLASAVEWYANSTFADTQVDVSLDLQDKFADLQSDLAAAIYRAYTELCMNVIKHAGATRVHVELKACDGNICIAVSDDGSGIEPGRELAAAASGGGYGLFSIRERFAGLGGGATISTSELGGARVLLCAPIRRRADG